jgi:hypothetical protein
MRVLVCGGRDYADYETLSATLENGHARERISLIVHGGAKGADCLAGVWAFRRGVKCEVFPADWDKDGRAAGPIRNIRMLRESKPDIVLAFPGGKGTAHMISIARKAGVAVVEILR